MPANVSQQAKTDYTVREINKDNLFAVMAHAGSPNVNNILAGMEELFASRRYRVLGVDAKKIGDQYVVFVRVEKSRYQFGKTIN